MTFFLCSFFAYKRTKKKLKNLKKNETQEPPRPRSSAPSSSRPSSKGRSTPPPSS